MTTAKGSSAPGASPRRGLVVGPAITLGAILLSELLARTFLADNLVLISLAYTLPLAGVVYAALVGGLVGGVASAAAAGLFAIHHYQRVHVLFPDVQDRVLLGGGVAAFTLALAALVGLLEERSLRQQKAALEAERIHSAQLEAKNAELARANAELAAMNEALEAFSYVVSHDLKEPVRALNAFSRALEEDHGPQLPPEARELAHRNVEAGRRLSRLLDGLLEYSRASRISATDLEPVRVEEILATPDCATRFEHVLAERHARLHVTPGPAVLASVTGLGQVLGNVVLNALKHNPHPKPLVTVCSRTWRDDPAFVEVVVEDNGPGFPPSVLQRFEGLKQGRPSTVRGGFGLLIARRGVERMGGRMWLGESAEHGGASVHFTLPAAGTPRSPTHGTGERVTAHAPGETTKTAGR